ncbi:lysine exporter LysO family protein [Aliivibrio sp. S4TY2]|uniref:lysine exporter LysO family protein n=1 Tax=unclassified Aliivibrio TaxID=2645654 RepID=UPI002379067D|nr:MULTISPECIES: lysine exporter LysO family protein [unclassified Aliivibrio]MDD9156551.1 lysine exporter LysO family protein [Aliivibrio sp. S4TY2]MDD9160012.1 lysine exporter LysO family protein [Aliivibrio sp. S4TY1]MDD9164234.1 lysine exporter LysO family protein [Aliivibrio sp. S4MY2]MDD9168258.1 lysine exporter LysO family protein [Aliivibrio sp. S4MY4]MDD9184594.1 lysine exporter LysO family protein [Aliivibrio sp. S4MY3]
MLSGMLFVFLPLLFGYLIPLHKKQPLQYINAATSHLVTIILALMGLSLAALDNLAQNLNQILTITTAFFICISVCNLAILPIMDKLFPLNSEGNKNTLPLFKMILESAKLLLAVAVGLLFGLISGVDLSWVEEASELILLILLFLIGIQLRNSGLSLRQILLNKHGIIIATVILTTSLIGGLIAALILGIPLQHGLAMASGFGWYSLAGILMGDALGPVYGGAAFLNELMRELVALLLIPTLIHRYPVTSIGYAGATAMDFTLPVIQNCGGIRCVPIAIVSGFILSLLVPFLMLFFVSL